MAVAPLDSRRRALTGALFAATPLWLGGCALSGPAPRQEFHLLRDDSGSGKPSAATRTDAVLLVSASAPSGLYDSDRMVYSSNGQTRSYFQFGFWSERPAQSLQTLAVMRLAQSGWLREVDSSTAGVRGDLLLTLRLDELYLDTSVQPAQARLGVTAELIDWRQRTLLARRRLQHAAVVNQADAAGLAAAGSRALGALLDELAPWVASAAA